MRTNESQRPTLKLVGDGERRSGSASSIFGPVRAGLTTTQTTQSPVRMVLLKGWERRAITHASRSSKGFAILNTDTTRRVERGASGSASIITDMISERW